MIDSFLKHHQILFLDTMIFIYHFENHPKYINLTRKFFFSIEKGANQGLTTVISAAEILVKPYELEVYSKIQDYQIALNNFPNLSVLYIDLNTANLAASICAKYQLDLTDALQIGNALLNNVSAFITNDFELKTIKEIKVITLDSFLN